jgi:large subunit ribosomal protein L6
MKGVSDGFEKVLEFEGVGYKAAVKGKDLELNLGYSHPITIKAPDGITFAADKDSIKISGPDKELVGQIAYEIRSKRFPEPYQGSGIRYRGEVIRRKAGKKAATTA